MIWEVVEQLRSPKEVRQEFADLVFPRAGQEIIWLDDLSRVFRHEGRINSPEDHRDAGKDLPTDLHDTMWSHIPVRHERGDENRIRAGTRLQLVTKNILRQSVTGKVPRDEAEAHRGWYNLSVKVANPITAQ